METIGKRGLYTTDKATPWARWRHGWSIPRFDAVPQTQLPHFTVQHRPCGSVVAASKRLSPRRSGNTLKPTECGVAANGADSPRVRTLQAYPLHAVLSSDYAWILAEGE